MTSKHKKHDDEAPTPQPISGEVAPGCSEPGTVPPSVTGTSQDPKREKHKPEKHHEEY